MTKPITRKMAVDCLLYRIGLGDVCQGIINKDAKDHLICIVCFEPLLPGQQIQFDHIHAHGMGGPHEYKNLRPIHYDPCHKKKTARDVGAIAKINRITGKTKGRRGPKMRSGKKLQNRNAFPPPGSTPMRRKK